MSNFAKKMLSVVSGLAVVVTAVIPAGVSAAMTQSDAANTLAGLGVIVDQSADTSAYRLSDTITREELAKVISKLGGLTAVEGNSIYQDTDFASWAEKYAKALNEAGYAASNAYFNPKDNSSKIEGLKWVMEARDIASGSNADWKAARVEGAVVAGIANSFSDYDTDVTRGQVFVWAAEALALEDDDDLFDDLFNNLDDDLEDPETPVVVGDGELAVSLSPETPVSATIPGGVNGLAVAKFDFTAGDEDVTVTQISLKRTGLSDDDTLESIAIFTDAGRASNAKSDNQDNDTTAQINLNDGGIVVQAGETVTLTAVVDLPTIASNPSVEGDEFALQVVAVIANGEVSGLGAKANTMEVGSVDAPILVFGTSGTVSDPNLGEKGADIFEFEIDNSSDEDVILRTLTFEGSSDAEDDLMNFELFMGNDLVATTVAMNGDYLTFDLGEGLLIEEDRNEDFTVRADVVDGAGDDIEFYIDEELDVSADSTKFDAGAGVDISAVDSSGDLGTVTIEAGELTFVEKDVDYDEIREDKENLVLGMIDITNVSGQQLEMEEFGVTIELTSVGAAYIDLNDNGVDDGGAEAIESANLFDEVELYNEETGSSYELTTSDAGPTATFSDNNIDVLLSEGTTSWAIRADTAEDIGNFGDVTIQVSVDVSNDVFVVETADDEEVTDKTPSSLSFNTIDGSESGAQVSLIPLADTDVVRGSDDVVSLHFEVEAEEVSDITVEEITVNIDANGSSATNQEISKIVLLADGVVLDQESGSDIGTGGDVTFDAMPDFLIAANDVQEFVVTLSFVDGDDAVTNSDYTVSLTAMDIDDDENDNVDVTAQIGGGLASARQITVNQAGTIVTVALDDANEDNEFDKLALAGESTIIASFDVRADNEEVDVETATFTIAGFAGLGELKDTVINASLLLDGVVVETNTSSDIFDTSIVFEDMTDLILPETTTELALRFNTANIGEDETGEALANLSVTQLVLSDARGEESGKDTTDGDSGVVASKTLDIVTAVVTPSVTSEFGTDDNTAHIRLLVDGGANTDTNGDAVQAELLSFDIEVTSLTATGTLTVFNGNGAEVGTAVVAAASTINIVIDDASGTTGDSIGNDDETYRLEGTAEASYRLATDGVTYSTNGVGSTSTKLENTQELGQYAESN